MEGNSENGMKIVGTYSATSSLMGFNTLYYWSLVGGSGTWCQWANVNK